MKRKYKLTYNKKIYVINSKISYKIKQKSVAKKLI